MKVKNDHKTIEALRQGLKDGVLGYAIDLPMKDNYGTNKESKAYKTGYHIACNKEYTLIYQNPSYTGDLVLLDYAIAVGQIVPVGWAIYKTVNGWFIE